MHTAAPDHQCQARPLPASDKVCTHSNDKRTHPSAARGGGGGGGAPHGRAQICAALRVLVAVLDQVRRGVVAPAGLRLVRRLARHAVQEPCLRKRAVVFFGWVFFLISSGGQAPHVLRAHVGVHRTCVRGAKRNRIDRHRGEIERLARRTVPRGRRGGRGGRGGRLDPKPEPLSGEPVRR